MVGSLSSADGEYGFHLFVMLYEPEQAYTCTEATAVMRKAEKWGLRRNKSWG